MGNLYESLYSAEEVEILKKHPGILRVKRSYLMFTPEFKEKLFIPLRTFFIENGIDPEMLKEDKIKRFIGGLSQFDFFSSLGGSTSSDSIVEKDKDTNPSEELEDVHIYTNSKALQKYLQNGNSLVINLKSGVTVYTDEELNSGGVRLKHNDLVTVDEEAEKISESEKPDASDSDE